MDNLLPLIAGTAGLGLLHGIEPGHGWPVAAAWALARPARWRAGVLAATVLGVGHLISSIAVVVLFFTAKEFFDLGATRWLDWVAGGLLLLLAAWQLFAVYGRNGGHHHHHHHHHHHEATAGHTHAEEQGPPAPTTSLWALAVFAFTLGFAHEEEFQIIALCAGTEHCLSLMLIYAGAVVVGLIGLTLLSIAGLEHFGHRLEHAQRQLTLLSAVILAAMGIGFLAGIF